MCMALILLYFYLTHSFTSLSHCSLKINETLLVVTHSQVLLEEKCAIRCYGSLLLQEHTLCMKSSSSWFLIAVLHFRSLEGCGSSVNYISAGVWLKLEAEILSHKHSHSLLLFDWTQSLMPLSMLYTGTQYYHSQTVSWLWYLYLLPPWIQWWWTNDLLWILDEVDNWLPGTLQFCGDDPMCWAWQFQTGYSLSSVNKTTYHIN